MKRINIKKIQKAKNFARDYPITSKLYRSLEGLNDMNLDEIKKAFLEEKYLHV